MKYLLGNMRIRSKLTLMPLVVTPFVIAGWATAAGVSGQKAPWLSAVLLASAIALSFIVVSIVAKSMLSSLRSLEEGVMGALDGDLTKRSGLRSSDEIGRVGEHTDAFLDKLLDTVTLFSTSSVVVSNTAFTLEKATKEMMAGVEEAAVQVGSVATASEQMSGTSSEIAQNCASAAKSSENANSAAMAGESVINETVNVMNRINDIVKTSASIIEGLGSRSDQIGEIIDLIDDIADQTNLLALNAAIEAARAGEHGRGFAVVADEVRKLAEKTSAATKQIGDTIKAMQSDAKQAVISMDRGVKEVAVGTEEARKSGAALEDILKQIGTVSNEIGQIAVASEEQTATVNEIATSIHQMSGVMGGTANNVSQNSGAISELAKLSHELSTITRQYRLATMAEVEETVANAVAFLKAHGKEEFLTVVNDPKGQFMKKGLFVLVENLSGMLLAHNSDISDVGKDMTGLKDAHGKYFVKDGLELARNKGKGWIEIAMPSQATKGIEKKFQYLQRVDDWVICCGHR